MEKKHRLKGIKLVNKKYLKEDDVGWRNKEHNHFYC